MTKNQRKSRDKAAVESPANDGVRREGKGRDGGEPERELEGKRKKKGGKSQEEVKEKGSRGDERREDGGGKGKKKRKGTEDEVAVPEVKGGSEKGVAGGKMKKGKGDTTKEDEPKAIASSFEGRKFGEDDVRKLSKKQREGKKEGGDMKVAEGSGLSRKQQQNGDEKTRSNGSVSQSDPSLVLSLSRSMQRSKSDSPNKKNNEKPEANQQRSESKKRKSSERGIRDVSVPASRMEETEEGTKKAEDDNGHGLKKKRTMGEKVNDKGPKGCSLPLSRVRNIIRSNNLNSKVTGECYTLICKATECFINQFCEDAFELAASRGLKNVLKYEHLSSLVYNMDRYDFLSDYVPQKIKAKDAIAEAKAWESRQD
ncbi:hypothetical protein MLD38_011640 [Melastoma candidum]|uniref:Uncharacterized protein n=1 Tax=Melastoma candidum TaxID=119954 RepID=A0ACB9R6P8_9MYRT|nr:hypothetical protein MLD38_011640 [Melastoma candidum]